MPVHDTPINPAYISLISSDYTLLNNALGSRITFELYQPIIVDTNVDTWLKLENFKFTNSMYNVSIYSNVFYFGLASGGYTSQSVTITRSNYDVTSLLVALNNIGNGFTFTYSSQTLKITVSNAQNFKLYSGSNNILKVIGFSNSLQTSVTNTVTSNNIINLIGSQMLYLSLPNLSMNSYGVKRSVLNTSVSTIASIPVSAIQGDTQNFTSDLHHKINDKIINFIEVRISDENGNEVNFNGIEWYLTISLMFTYKKEYKKPTYLTDVQGQPVEDNQDNSLDNPDINM
jgi:hypothetical protein